MTTQTSVEREIAALEERYWQAIKDRDMETVLQLTDNPSIIAGASGVTTIDHAMYRQMMESNGPSAFTLHTESILGDPFGRDRK